MAKTKPTYETLRAELDALMAELQREDLDVDEAVTQYERGLQLVKELEQYLASAENKVKELKAAASAD
jgi:exodeoxyribonuclease VII small subunit